MKIHYKRFLILLLVLASAFAQNYLLDEDQNSLHLKGKFTNYFSNLNIIEIEPGYTFNGQTTVTANYRQYLFGHDPFETLVFFTGAGINYKVVEQGVFPVSVYAGASYEFGLIEYVEIQDDSDSEYMKVHEYILYTNYSRRFSLSKDIKLVPSVSAGIVSRNVIYPIGWRLGQTPIHNKFAYSIQADIVFRSFYAFVKNNFYSNSFDNAFDISFSTFDFGIGVMLNSKAK